MGTFAGRVFVREPDGAIGDEVVGARLEFKARAHSVSATTGSNGSYRVELPNGTYTVSVQASGFDTATTRAVLRSGLHTLNLFLSHPAPTTGIRGRVFERNPDGSVGGSVAEARVAATRVGLARATVADADGRYSLALPPGRYDVDGRSEGFTPVHSRVMIRTGMSTVNIFLEAAEAPTGPDFVDLCTLATDTEGETRTSEVVIPGGGIAELTYQVVNGKAVLEGGIILGDVNALADEVAAARQPADTAPDRPETPTVGVRQQALVALASRSKLWEGGVMPYQFDEVNQILRERIAEAMQHISDNTNISFDPVSGRTEDRVLFRLSRDSGASSAELGHRTGTQNIWLNESFDVGGIVHEILHALGVFHEQTRNDRDGVVTINWANIEDGREGNFRKSVNRGGADIGPYDVESIMHYGAQAFGKDDPANPGTRLITIQPRDPSIALSDLGSARKAVPYLSAGDIDGLNRLYPSKREFDGGHLWGSDNFTTAVALGDFDGDGRDELLVGRQAGANGRYYVFDDAVGDFSRLLAGGASWGSGNYVTCCAAGDVDGDGRDEIIVGRRAGGGMRFQVSKVRGPAGGWREDVLFTGGTDWGGGNYTTDVAFGMDASGTPLIGVARRAGDNARFFVYAGAGDGFRLLFSGGRRWGSGNYATGIAFGDVDGDGRLELGITRKAGDNARWFVLKDVAGDYTDFQTVHSGGVDWGSGNYATGIAFGDVDGDGRDEIAVSRKAGGGGRYFVFDDFNANFRLLESGGTTWGDGNYATAVALGDVDGDGRAELAVTRKAGENARVMLVDDEVNNYRPLWDEGRTWGSGNFATCVALGNGSGGSRQRHIAVGRKAGANMRFSVIDYNP